MLVFHSEQGVDVYEKCIPKKSGTTAFMFYCDAKH